MSEYSVEKLIETWPRKVGGVERLFPVEVCRVSFPNDSRLLYSEDPLRDESNPYHHKYFRTGPEWHRGKQIAGGSTITSTFDLRPDTLNKWIGREAALSGDADPGREKRDLGTRVHEVAERLALGEKPNVDAMPEEDQGYVRALLRFWEEKQPEVIACEQFVFHGDLGYGGQLDLRAWVDGFHTVYDYKTAKSLYPKYGAQLVAYDAAAEWCGIGAADELLILKLCEDGNYYEVPAFVTREEFSSAMDTRKVAGRVRGQQERHIKAVDAERLQEAA